MDRIVPGYKRLIDLTGQKFGELSVIKLDRLTNKKIAYWVCCCSCNTILSVAAYALRNGNTQSCGCRGNSARGERPGERAWKTAVHTKDNFECVACQATTNLQAHHILSFTKFPELRLDVDNGTTLCKFCHVAFHSKYGYFTFDANDLKNFLLSEKKH